MSFQRQQNEMRQRTQNEPQKPHVKQLRQQHVQQKPCVKQKKNERRKLHEKRQRMQNELQKPHDRQLRQQHETHFGIYHEQQKTYVYYDDDGEILPFIYISHKKILSQCKIP